MRGSFLEDQENFNFNYYPTPLPADTRNQNWNRYFRRSDWGSAIPAELGNEGMASSSILLKGHISSRDKLRDSR